MPQASGQGDTKQEAITDTKKGIRLCKSYLEKQKKSMA
jgi:predicted RNase H-like HicB family nuclease